MTIRPIRTPEDYEAVLARIDALWEAAPGSEEADELDVLPLAFHVDYWNYLGWKDRFSSPRFTSRQRMLGTNNLQRTIYTPEFFVNGVEARGAGNILGKIQHSNRRKAPLQLQLRVSRAPQYSSNRSRISSRSRKV